MKQSGIINIRVLTLLLCLLPSVAEGQSREALRAEASEQASQFWFAKMTRCGEFYFTKERNYVHQFRGVNISTTTGRPVSAADRLNGLEWRGHTALTVGQSRTFSPQRTLYQNSGWSKWSDGFTPSMGGIGLDATIQKRNGRWTIAPNSLSQVANLQRISCSDAANPVGAAKRKIQMAVVTGIQRYKERAASRGIYAGNLSDEMWAALYRVGNTGSDVNYTTVSSVYLAANGGWAFCGRSGCELRGVGSLPEAFWVEQVTKDDGYVFLRRGIDERGRAPRGFIAQNIPQGLHNQLSTYDRQGLTIKQVRIGYNGEWFVLAQGEDRCLGCATGDFWTWNSLSPGAHNALQSMSDAYKRNAQNAESIGDVAFRPNGGFVMIYGKYKFFTEGMIPHDAMRVLQMLSASRVEINEVTFGPNDSWIIRANGWW